MVSFCVLGQVPCSTQLQILFSAHYLHILLCWLYNVKVLLSEFSERSEQPSAPDVLCSAHRTASPQLHQCHISMSVCNMHYEPTTSAFLFIFPSLHAFSPLSSFKRNPAVDWEAVWSSGDTHGTFFLLHPVCHGQPDPAQTGSAEQRGGPRPCGGQGVRLVIRLQDVDKYDLFQFVFLQSFSNSPF